VTVLERIRFRRWWRPPRTASQRPEERRVTFLELFYDLVYVVIIAELSHALAEHISLAGFGTFVFLSIIVWWAWFRRTPAQRGALAVSRGNSYGDWKQKIGFMGIAKLNQKDLVLVKELLEAGKVKPVLDRRYPLSQTAEAIRYLEEGHARGKVVITLESNNKI